jgi:hypothetical protein
MIDARSQCLFLSSPSLFFHFPFSFFYYAILESGFLFFCIFVITQAFYELYYCSACYVSGVASLYHQGTGSHLGILYQDEDVFYEDDLVESKLSSIM